jgi:hypothetical protein
MKAYGVEFSLGFMKSTAALPFGSARSFGSRPTPAVGSAKPRAPPAPGTRT